MEYLMTYGWSILIVAVVLGALSFLGVFNPLTFAPKASAGGCQVIKNTELGVSNLVGSCNNQVPQYVAQFNGRNYILADKPRLPTYVPVTLVAWINPDSGASGGITGWGSPACDGDTYAIVLGQNSILAAGAGCSGVYSSLHSKTGTWSFVAISMNSSGEMFYLNGATSKNTISPGSILSVNFTTGTYNFGVNGGIGEALQGYISNIQIYNTSLTNSSIETLYQEGIGGVPIDLNNLVAWYPLNGNANDYSGNQNNGVPTNVVFTSDWYGGYTQP
jgi:hypothetical protein